jgi:hypothetical protein
VQKAVSWQRPFTDPVYDAPAPQQTPSVQAKRRNVDWSRVTVEAQSPAAVQTKLTVGAPGDKYSPVADATANQIMSMPAPVNDQPIQREKSSNSDGTIQRMLNVTEAGGVITAKGNGTRPAGSLSNGGQGDHTTPYVTFEHQLINAIQGTTTADAWTNLIATHDVYRNLPGYSLSPKWLTKQSEESFNINSAVDASTATADNIEEYANTLLEIRNRLKYTSLPTKGGTTGGNNKSQTAGGLHWLEGQLRQGKTITYTKEDAIINMWNTFDHERFEDVSKEDDRRNILTQHIKSILDSYPLVTEYYGITEADLFTAYPGTRRLG